MKNTLTVLLTGLMIFALAQTSVAIAAESNIKQDVVQLKFRSAELLVDALQGVLSPYESIHALGPRTLTIRAREASIAEVRDLAAKLDTAQAVYRVTLIEARNAPSDRQSRVRSTYSKRQSKTQRSLIALEGETARFDTGTSIQVLDSFQQSNGQISGGIRYENINRELEVQVLPYGDGVEVQLQLSSDRPAASGNKDIERTALRTKLRGNTGQWLEVAGIGPQSAETRGTVRNTINYNGRQRFWLRIDRI